MIFGHGKCPKCGQAVTHAEIEAITIGDRISGPLHRGVSYVCPNAQCHAVLGVAIDPIALREQTVERILEGMGVKPKRR